jgi:PAS domain S-box-containing protein
MLIENKVNRVLRLLGNEAANDPRLREVVERELAEAIADARTRQQAEIVVAMSEEDAVRYRVISELASDWVYAARVDEGAVKLEWTTEGFHSSTGYTVEEVNERGGYGALLHPDDRHVWEATDGLLKKGRPTVLEYRAITRNGTVRWFRDYARPELDKEARRVVRIYGAAKDITQEKHAEEALHDALVQLEERVGMEGARFRAVIDAAGDAIFVIDPKTGHLIDVNETACRSLGYRRSELLTSTIEDVLAESTFWQSKDFSRLELHGGGRIAFETRQKRKNGDTFPVEVTVSLKRFIGRDYLLAVARDRTESKEMEARLAQSDRLASVGVLAAGVAHEVNNPLVYILNNISYVLRQLPIEYRELADALREARSGAERVRDIVQGLKTFSRSDDEKIQPVDPRSLLDSAIKVAHNEIRHRAQLVREYESVPLVMANARLEQVFLNLLLNAAYAIGEGNADQNRITVSVRQHEDLVAICVQDTGTGIPAEQIPKIFDPFFTTKPIGVGTGLGLSICRNITESLGGRIEVQSSPGKGAAFTVFLPAAAAQTPVAEHSRPKSILPPNMSRSLNVLVVDDDALVARSVRRLLKTHHEVTLALSGKEALELISGNRYDVVFCDVMMPEMTGFELHRIVVERDRKLADRFVFITGGPFTEEASSLLGTTVNACVQKPFTSADLVAVMEEVVLRSPTTSMSPTKYD